MLTTAFEYRSKRHVCFVHLLVIGFGIASGQTTKAQEEALPGPVNPQNKVESARKPDLDVSDIYLNDSFEAADALAKAKSFAAKGKWSDAAAVAQQAIDGAGDRLVRSGKGQYVGIRDHMNDWIATWPAAGLAAYRELVEPAASSAMRAVEESRDENELLPLFERFFCTSAGAKLADMIGRLAIEAGDFSLAGYVYTRVLEKHPDRETYGPRYRAMKQVIAAMQGDKGAEADSTIGDVRLTWKGEDQSLREILGDLRKDFGRGSAPSPDAPSDWPIHGGDASRNREGALKVDEPGLLWRFEWNDQGQADGTGAGSSESGARSQRERSRELSVFPVISDGFVYAQHFREIIALRANTGALAWRFQPDLRPPETISFLDDLPAAWDSVTVNEGKVYAALPVVETPYYNFETSRSASEILCLDGQTGRVLWRTGGPEADERLSEIIFDSSPIVHNDRLFVVGRRKRAFGFEDCYLFRFNTADGAVEHRTHLGSASTSGLGMQLMTKAVAAMQGDSVYVCSSLGTVASVSAHTGAVRWLRVYERARGDSAAAPRSGREQLPWSLNPVVWAEGRIFCVPNDSNNLLVLGADDGKEISIIPLEQIGGMEMLLGVRGDLLWGAGREAFCFDLAARSMKWSTKLPEGAQPAARGALTHDEMLVPQRAGISRFRLADGTRSEMSLDEEGEPGNLVAAGDRLVSAGARGVSAYVRKMELWESLRRRMVSAPSDPVPAIELAEVAFGAGEKSQALSMLAEAAQRATGFGAETAIRTRIFTDGSKFAEVLARKSQLDEDSLELLFRHTAELAVDPQANVAYRLTFASLFEKLGKPERAVRLHQQILRDRSLRELPRSSGNSVLRGGAIAQAEVARLINQHGRSVYAEFDREAKQWFEQGKSTGDAETLQRLLDTFPESESAPPAYMALADMMLKKGQPEAAARQYAKAYRRYAGHADRPVLMRKIADAWAKAGRPQHAYRWLSKAVIEYPNLTFNDQGTSVTFLQYRDRLGIPRANVEESRPTVRLPLSQNYALNGEAAALLSPEFFDAPRANWSAFYVLSSSGLMGHDARTGRALWATPSAARANTALLVARDDLAVFASLDEVFAVDSKSGSRRWTVGGESLQIKENAGDWEQAASLRAHALSGDRLFSSSDDGRLMSIDLSDGRVRWVAKRRPAPLGRIRVAEPWIVYHFVQDGRAVLCIVDSESGEWIGEINTDEKRALEELFVTIDGQIVTVTAQSIASYDIEMRARRWQVPLGGNLRRGSLVLDLDALYGSDTGNDLRKIALEDGRILWQTERLTQRADEDMTVYRQGGNLIVTTSTAISAVDAGTGLTLWRGTTPEKVKFAVRTITDAYLTAINLPPDDRDAPALLYFYEHRNDSGIIPRDGVKTLGPLGDLRAMLALDGAIVLQAGTSIQGFTSE